jgi:hypothetical protein
MDDGVLQSYTFPNFLRFKLNVLSQKFCFFDSLCPVTFKFSGKPRLPGIFVFSFVFLIVFIKKGLQSKVWKHTLLIENETNGDVKIR